MFFTQALDKKGHATYYLFSRGNRDRKIKA